MADQNFSTVMQGDVELGGAEGFNGQGGGQQEPESKHKYGVDHVEQYWRVCGVLNGVPSMCGCIRSMCTCIYDALALFHLYV